LEFDRIIVALDCQLSVNINSIFKIKEQLVKLGVREQQICVANNDDNSNEMKIQYPRVEFLNAFAEEHSQSEGVLAECGVCFGDFAFHINACFPDKRLHLFDTFESFAESDMNFEDERVCRELQCAKEMFGMTSPELVRLKMLHKNNLVIHKGYVPNSLKGIDEKFLFVNLDMDLYLPTLGALRFFADKMTSDGIILVHDYYSLSGVTRAVSEFSAESKVVKIPIGDLRSVAIKVI
jgi:hypothetical protein